MPDEAQSQLIALVERHGAGVVNDRARCHNLIADYCTTDRKSINLLTAALDEGVASDLRVTDAASRDIKLDILRSRMEQGHGMTEAAARWAVESWALALGIIDTALPLEKPHDTSKTVPYRRQRLLHIAPWASAALLGVVAITLFVSNQTLSGTAATLDQNNTSLNAELETIKKEYIKKKDIDVPEIYANWSALKLKDSNSNIFSLTSAQFKGTVGRLTGSTSIYGSNLSFEWDAHLDSLDFNLQTKRNDFTWSVGTKQIPFIGTIKIVTRPDGQLGFKSYCPRNDLFCFDEAVR